jgi:methylaspartate ammonia-lyase
MKKILTLLGSGMLLLSAVGCSSNGEISDITKASIKTSFVQTQGLISGSLQNFKTASGHLVSSSVGSWTDGSITQTTAAGYKVYSTVQGDLASEISVTTQE